MKKVILFLSFLLLTTLNSQALEFEYNGAKLNYNPDTLKFYNGEELLDSHALYKIFPDYKIILVSEFDNEKKYRIKNSLFGTKKILLLNDTKRTFHLFEIFPKTSRYEQNPEIKSLIKMYGKKNVRLKHAGGDEFEIVAK